MKGETKLSITKEKDFIDDVIKRARMMGFECSIVVNNRFGHTDDTYKSRMSLASICLNQFDSLQRALAHKNAEYESKYATFWNLYKCIDFLNATNKIRLIDEEHAEYHIETDYCFAKFIFKRSGNFELLIHIKEEEDEKPVKSEDFVRILAVDFGSKNVGIHIYWDTKKGFVETCVSTCCDMYTNISKMHIFQELGAWIPQEVLLKLITQCFEDDEYYD